MMELFFILIWTTLFITVFLFVWPRIMLRFKTYLLILLNLIFLVGIFYFYPVPDSSKKVPNGQISFLFPTHKGTPHSDGKENGKEKGVPPLLIQHHALFHCQPENVYPREVTL